MKKAVKVLSILLIAFQFSGCSTKEKNKEIERLQLEITKKEEIIQELNNQINIYRDSIAELEKGNPIEKIVTLLGTGISNVYFPQMNENVKTESFDLSILNEEEKNFYFNYAGCYFRSENQDPIRARYSCQLASVENGISFFRLGNTGIKIFYNRDDNSFYESDSITASRINYKTYELSEEYRKISYNIDNEKNELRSEINSVENKEILKLLTSFFSYLSDGNFNDIVANCYSVSNFRNIRYDMVVEQKTADELISDLAYLKRCFGVHNNPIKFYSNIFFSEDKKLYDSFFNDYTLIEFEYPNIFNYFSFVIKKINGEYKIISYRNELNMM